MKGLTIFLLLLLFLSMISISGCEEEPREIIHIYLKGEKEAPEPCKSLLEQARIDPSKQQEFLKFR